MTARSGRPVRVLRQAVDARQLPSADAPTGDGSRPVFVGGKYGDRRRQVVFDAMQAGIDFEVHGPGWEGLIPAPVLRCSYVPEPPGHRRSTVLVDWCSPTTGTTWPAKASSPTGSSTRSAPARG